MNTSANSQPVRARERRLQELEHAVPQITPEAAVQLQAQGAVLLDIREPEETARGSPASARRLGRSFLELQIEEAVPDLSRTVLVLCGSGVRSLFAAEDLIRLGYQDVRSVQGGFQRWQAAGLPVEIPRQLDQAARERYARHLNLPQVGEAGQLKLLRSKVLLVGAGGLGSPAALYLAAAGIGTLGLVDDDLVDRSNLQRQVVHTDARIGQAKVDSARTTLLALNPTLTINTYPVHLGTDNVEDIFSGYEVIVDGSDNFATRYLINDACVKLVLPNVHGAIARFEGYVTVFWSGAGRNSPCYRCLYPEPPAPSAVPSCTEAGVLGVLPGVIGVLQATETIKLLLQIGTPLVGRMLYYDALAARFNEVKIPHNPGCRYCGEGKPFPGYGVYDGYCDTRAC